MFQGIDPATEEKRALVVGPFYQALLLGVRGQWLVDPDSAPSAHDLTDALRTIVAALVPIDEFNTVDPVEALASADGRESTH